jgi:hypothetical protein
MIDRRNFLSGFGKIPLAVLIFTTHLFLTFNIEATDASNKMDFDGDGKTDIAVYRAGQRNVFPLPPSYFYIFSSQTNQLITRQWGRAYDIHTPADYDGDGKTDAGIFRWIDNDLTPTASHFWINYSLGGHSATHFSGFGNIISRNYFDDGRAEIAVFDRYDVSKDPTEPCFIWAFFIKPSGSDFALKKDVSNQCQSALTFLTPAVADFNSDGKSDVTVFEKNLSQPGQSRFKIWHSPVSPIYTPPEIDFPFDIDYPIPSDYDGDGIAEIAGTKNVNGIRLWRIRASLSGLITQIYFGFESDYPVPGDYDGDGKTDIAVFRPSSGVWYIIRSSDNALIQIAFGLATDIPLTMPNSNIYY